MKRQLLGLALWLAIGLSLAGIYLFIENRGSSAPPSDFAHRLLAVLISWSPFLLVALLAICVALVMRRAVLPTGGPVRRQLTGFVLWLVLASSLGGMFHLLQHPDILSVPPPDRAYWFLALAISWSPFFFFVALWFVISLAIKGGGASCCGQEAPFSMQALDDPSHWGDCAARARGAAEQFADPESRRQMLEIAQGYAYLAQRAEGKRRGPGS